MVLSLLIMYYNIGLPNPLRGFLFYSQVSYYINIIISYSYYISTVDYKFEMKPLRVVGDDMINCMSACMY